MQINKPTLELALYITLEKPPEGVAFGLQKGSGNNYQTIDIKISDGGDLHFKLAIQIKGDPIKDPDPKLAGPFVQGPTGAKFFYFDIGALAGQAGGWSRRLKIPLSGITWDMINQVTETPGAILETTVPGTAKDGGPNCATVKLFEGWKVKSA